MVIEKFEVNRKEKKTVEIKRKSVYEIERYSLKQWNLINTVLFIWRGV